MQSLTAASTVVLTDPTYNGNDGVDTISAGDGNFNIQTGNGASTIVTGNGNQTITNGAGVDTITTGTGLDNIQTGNGASTIVTGDGDKTIINGAGVDTITYGNGSNYTSVGTGANTMVGGGGNNYHVSEGVGVDTITLTDGDNCIDASDGANTIVAGSGINLVIGGSGADTITVGDGDNRIDAFDGANTIVAGSGNNVIIGGNGVDTITAMGGTGNNYIEAGNGANTVTTGDGTDYIVTGNGVDTIVAGGGDDYIKVNVGGADTINGGVGNDTLDLSAFGSSQDVTIAYTAGSTTAGIITGQGSLITFSNIENIIFDDAQTATPDQILGTVSQHFDPEVVMCDYCPEEMVHEGMGYEGVSFQSGDNWYSIDEIDPSNNIITGVAGEYSQHDYSGSHADYRFTMNTDGTINVESDNHAPETLENINGIWFEGSMKWASIEELVTMITDPTNAGVQAENYHNGTIESETFVGKDQEYSQVDLLGSKADYEFFVNDTTGVLTSSSNFYGTDTYDEIDGIWFTGDETWSSTDGLAYG